MRIIKELNHEGMKITILVMNGKFSIKIEKDLLEQTYKFRDGSGIESAEDIYKIMDEGFYSKISEIFKSMSENRKNVLKNFWNDDNEFPTII